MAIILAAADSPAGHAARDFAVQEARRLDTELVVFPGAFLGGYPKGLTFGAPVGTRTRAGREEFLRYAN